MTGLRILVLTRYGELGASSRLRFFQYKSAFQNDGIQLEIHPLFKDEMLAIRYAQGTYRTIELIKSYINRSRCMMRRHSFDMIWIEKEALPWFPLWVESALLRGVPYVLDYDDAVFHNYDQHRLNFVRRIFSQRLDKLMSQSTLVVCGNNYLAERARKAKAAWIEVLPTAVDIHRYPKQLPASNRAEELPRIVWIGSPSTAKYLAILAEPLKELTTRTPFVLRVIGAEISMPDVRVECVLWVEATEVASIAECAVGVMPLHNSPWELGKCGYKLIQYMACGLPVVASDVGVNAEIVQNGVNGFLARDTNEWVNALEQLLCNKELGQQIGKTGRKQVEDKYCIQKTGSKLARWLKQASKKS
jgi:glycosyltransferase involved in cell wall biosynthesis